MQNGVYSSVYHLAIARTNIPIHKASDHDHE